METSERYVQSLVNMQTYGSEFDRSYTVAHAVLVIFDRYFQKLVWISTQITRARAHTYTHKYFFHASDDNAKSPQAGSTPHIQQLQEITITLISIPSVKHLETSLRERSP